MNGTTQEEELERQQGELARARASFRDETGRFMDQYQQFKQQVCLI